LSQQSTFRPDETVPRLPARSRFPVHLGPQRPPVRAFKFRPERCCFCRALIGCY
jgi:hypothetical protein